MNKINASAILNHATLTPQSSLVSARPAMAPHHLTPLIPPGSKLASTGGPEATHWRLALFDRAFDQLQQKLTERRQADSPGSASISGGLSSAEFRQCDAAAQWIAATLMSSGAR